MKSVEYLHNNSLDTAISHGLEDIPYHSTKISHHHQLLVWAEWTIVSIVAKGWH
jgi:hypothetical protein